LVFLIIENVIIISGFILIFRSSILAGFIILGIYLFIFIWMQIGGSTKSTRKTMLSAYINIKGSSDFVVHKKQGFIDDNCSLKT